MVRELPRVTESSVRQSNEVTPYYSVNASPEAFGASVGRALQGLGRSVGQLAQVEARIKKEQKSMDGFRKVAEAQDQVRDRLYNPNDGLMLRRGTQATGLTHDTDQVISQTYDRVLESIEDPEVRDTVERNLTNHRQSVLDSVAPRELKELDTARQDAQKSIVESSLADAYENYNNPEMLQHSVQQARGVLAANAKALGYPDEVLSQLDDEVTSSIYMAALERWAQEDPEGAFDFYNEYEDQISGADRVKARDLIDTAVTEHRAWNAVQGVTSVSRGTTQLVPIVRQLENAPGDPTAVSSAGALGTMQIMPETAREVARGLGLDHVANASDSELHALLTDPDQTLNQTLGSTYLDQMLKRFGNDVELALIAYNGGPRRAKEFLESGRDYSVLPQETQNYARKGLASWNQQYGRSGAPRGSVDLGTRMEAGSPETRNLKNFTFDQLVSNHSWGDETPWVDQAAAMAIDEAATAFYDATGQKFSINGGTRSEQRNTEVGGAPESQHLHGSAFDINIRGMDEAQQRALVDALRAQGFNGFGYYAGHIHADIRENPARWAKGADMPGWMHAKLDQDTATGRPNAGSYNVAGPTGQAPRIPSGPVVAPTEGFDLGYAQAQINGIMDPKVRRRAQQMLGVAEAQQTAQREAQEREAQGALWDHVFQGGNASEFIQQNPGLAGLIPSSFVNSVFSYEKNRAEGGPQTDPQAYQDLWMMPSREIAGVNPMDYVNQLSPSDYKRLVEKVAAAQEGALTGSNGARAANQRSRDKIATDTFGMVFGAYATPGKTPSTAQAQRFVQFSRAFDEAIEAEQVSKDRPLTGTEMQTIADRLMLETSSGFLGFGQNYAFETPEENVVETWEEVPREDAQRLMQTFQSNYGRQPEAEEARDLYNSATRVWRGGRPSEEPQFEEFREWYTKEYGRTDQGIMENVFRDWLLEYLAL